MARFHYFIIPLFRLFSNCLLDEFNGPSHIAQLYVLIRKHFQFNLCGIIVLSFSEKSMVAV
jgi:hypothetical protein